MYSSWNPQVEVGVEASVSNPISGFKIVYVGCNFVSRVHFLICLDGWIVIVRLHLLVVCAD
jgi:hypothetical protein